jgi:hypothetical protein
MLGIDDMGKDLWRYGLEKIAHDLFILCDPDPMGWI